MYGIKIKSFNWVKIGETWSLLYFLCRYWTHYFKKSQACVLIPVSESLRQLHPTTSDRLQSLPPSLLWKFCSSLSSVKNGNRKRKKKTFESTLKLSSNCTTVKLLKLPHSNKSENCKTKIGFRVKVTSGKHISFALWVSLPYILLHLMPIKLASDSLLLKIGCLGP